MVHFVPRTGVFQVRNDPAKLIFVLSALVLTGLLQTSAPGELAFAPSTGLDAFAGVGAVDELRPFPAQAMALRRTKGGTRLTELRDPFEGRQGSTPAPGDGVELRPFPPNYLAARTVPLSMPELRDPFVEPARVRPSSEDRRVLIHELRDPFDR